ncbi:MAG: fliD [Gemmataceae bacterium]|nr:fliD [Gemmataceae bacterium]
MASVGSISTSGLNFTGLATGIDTQKIIDGLTAINQKQIDTLNTKEAGIATQQATFSALQGKLFDLQSKTAALARSAGGAFDGRAVSSSDTTAVTAAAGTAAVPGVYTLTVGALAQANQVASQGFSDPNAAIKQGTLTVQVGSGTATTVTIDGRNNSLQGLADAINTAGGDVRASVINDGSATPYRLLLTANKTGASNAIAVTNNLTAGTGADINPTTTTVQAAADAQVTIGSGAGALVVTSPTNQVNNLIPGVTINLAKANPTNQVVLTVSNDTQATVKAVQDFVDSYNAVKDFITTQSKYDPTTQHAGVLLGNRDAASLADDLSSALSATIPGLNSGANRLSSVGLAFDDSGKLTFDSTKLTQALSGQGGVAPADLKRLFALSGTSDNPGVGFVIGTDKTKPTVGTPYQVQVTAPATRAVVIAAGPPPQPITVSPPNTTLQLQLDGLASSTITLPPGTYTPAQAAILLQQAINTNAVLNGHQVAVGLSGTGALQITSHAYGSSSKVAVTGGTALSALGFVGTETATGTNVAGSFVVNGQTELAAGTGQVLAGAIGNANTDGLQVRSTLSAPGTAGLTVSQGLASRLNQVLNKYLDPTNGRLKAINDGYLQQTKDITTTITKQNALLQTKTADLQSQFAAMETAVNNLKNVQTQLSSWATSTFVSGS